MTATDTLDTPFKAFTEGRITRAAFQLRRALQKFAKERVCCVSNATLLYELSFMSVAINNEGNLRRYKRELIKAGFLVVTEAFNKDGRQTPSFYRLTEPHHVAVMVKRSTVDGGGGGQLKPPPIRGLKETETKTSPIPLPLSPKRPGKPPGRAGPVVPAAVRMVLDTITRLNGGPIGELPAGVLRALEHKTTVHGPAGVVAGYRLWKLPDKPWSSWAAKTEYRLGAMLHEFTWPKIVDDRTWYALRRKHEAEFNRPAVRTIGAVLAGIASRAGP